MLKQMDILRAARDKLKKLYPLPVYLDEVKENFEVPCFFLKLIKETQPYNINAGKTFNDCLLIITYLATKGSVQAADIYDIKDSLTAAFWRGMTVGERWIHFAAIDSETDSQEAEQLFMELPFSYYDTDAGEEEDLPVIMHISHTERIKDTGDAHCEPEIFVP